MKYFFVVLILLLGISMMYSQDPVGVLVGRFKYEGKSSSLEYMDRMIANRILDRLGRSTLIHVLADSLGQSGSASGTGPNQRTVSEYARKVGAKYIISGTFADVGDALTISATEIDVATMRPMVNHAVASETQQGQKFFEAVDLLGDRLKSSIELDDAVKRGLKPVAAIVIEPPRPVTSYNVSVSRNVARGIKEVLQKSAEQLPFDVRYQPEKVDKYINGLFQPADLTRELSAQYLITVRVDRTQPGVRLRLSIYDFRKPVEPICSSSFRLFDQDQLYGNIGRITSIFLRKCWPGWTAAHVDTKEWAKYKENVDTWGLRLRATSNGFLRQSKDVFMGNNFRTTAEMSVILYDMPRQYELTGEYDFGKRYAFKSVVARYFSLLYRQNFPGNLSIRDVRPYVAVGPMVINVVAYDPAFAPQKKTSGGASFSAGVEALIWQKMYIDLNARYILPFGKFVGLSIGGAAFQTGSINSVSLGLGVGMRF